MTSGKPFIQQMATSNNTVKTLSQNCHNKSQMDALEVNWKIIS